MIKYKLRAKRKERKLSQEQFAELLFMDQSQYNRREQGSIKISDNEWAKMAKFLEVNIEEIFECDDKKINNIEMENINSKNTFDFLVKISIKEAQELSNNLLRFLKNNSTK